MLIKYDDVPIDHRKHIMYGKNVVTYRLGKDGPNRTQITVGRNRIMYQKDVSKPTLDMMTVKMHLNSVISTKKACYCTFNNRVFTSIHPWSDPSSCR